jgi:hypothetical protein
MVAGILCGPTQCQANNYIKTVTDCHTANSYLRIITIYGENNVHPKIIMKFIAGRNVVFSHPRGNKDIYLSTVALGGLVVSVLATGPKVRGFDGFLRVIQIRSTTSFGEEVKPSVPCRRFTACKRTLRA